MVTLQKSTQDLICQSLRSRIASGDLEPGTELKQVELAKTYGVSRMPIREALQLLATQGLVKLRPNKGAVVLGIDEKSIRDHFAVREILEREAAALAARPGSDLREVERVYAGMQECMAQHRYAEYKHYNESFHMALWEAAGNPKMTQILASLWNGLSLGFLVTETDYAKISFFEHEQLMEALRAHDPERARKLMDEHMKRSMDNILTNYREQVGKKR